MGKGETFSDVEKYFAGLNSLGLGTLTSPEIQTEIARVLLFGYMRKLMRPQLEHLRSICLPLYADLMDIGKQTFPEIRSDFPLLEGFAATETTTSSWMILVDSWNPLREATEYNSTARKLYDALSSWTTARHLSTDWFLHYAFRNVASWYYPSADEKLLWELPQGFTLGHNPRFSHTETFLAGRQLLKKLRVPVMVPYNPTAQTRKEHETAMLRQLVAYHDAQEKIFRDVGFIPSTRKRSRVQSNWTHMDWFVRYQILGWTAERIANNSPETAVNTASIYRAISTLARHLQLDLRPRGRPKKG